MSSLTYSSASGGALLVALLLVSACSGSTQGADSDSNAGKGSNADAGSGNSGGVDNNASVSSSPCIDQPCSDTGPRPTPLPRPHCPTTEPNAGDTCSNASLYCEYGDSPAVNCRTAYTCAKADAGTAWVADIALSKVYACDSAASCPSTPAPRTPCDVGSLGSACKYPGLVCSCRLSSHHMPGWSCLGAPENPICPEYLPNIGEGCAPNGVECDYAVDSCDPTPNRTLFCYEGAWERGRDLTCAL
jgi:hypothetical protein